MPDKPKRALGPHYKWIALSNTTLGVLMATINQSIVLIALPAVFKGIGLDPLGPGNTSTSIEEIAAQAGVSKPVVYEHFGGKEGLYAVVVDREVERLTTVTMMLFEKPHSKPRFEAAAVSLLRYIEENADGFRILVRDSNPGSGGGTYGTLLADIAGQVEFIMADFLKSRGRDPKLAPMYSQMMVGMVAFTGQWWLDARKPRLEQVAANLIDLAWNGLSQLDAQA